MNYGTLVIVDGSFRPSPPPAPQGRRGLARMEMGPDGALRPPLLAQNTGLTTLVLDLHYNDLARLYADNNFLRRRGPDNPDGQYTGPIVTDMPVGYNKTVKRLATGQTISSAKRLVSEFAGCSEAHKVRGRAIALLRMRKTISGEVFRFPLEAP